MTIIDDVFRCFEAAPGRVLGIHGLKTKTGCNDRQITDSIGVLRRRGVPIQAIARGGPWVYQPTAKQVELAQETLPNVGEEGLFANTATIQEMAEANTAALASYRAAQEAEAAMVREAQEAEVTLEAIDQEIAILERALEFERVGTSVTGEAILQDREGVFYRAVRL